MVTSYSARYKLGVKRSNINFLKLTGLTNFDENFVTFSKLGSISMTDRHNISVFERENRNIRNHLAVCCTELELLTFSCFQGGCISGVSVRLYGGGR